MRAAARHPLIAHVATGHVAAPSSRRTGDTGAAAAVLTRCLGVVDFTQVLDLPSTRYVESWRPKTPMPETESGYRDLAEHPSDCLPNLPR